MLRKILLPTILAFLAYGFWISPDFKEISAGVAIFLFGMFALQEGFAAFTGGALEKILRKSTNKMWKSLSFGFTAATVMQSSSLVSVITISFLSSGLIGLVEGMGILFGANVGTTTVTMGSASLKWQKESKTRMIALISSPKLYLLPFLSPTALCIEDIDL